MTGEVNPGTMEKNSLDELKLKLSQHPEGDVREAYRLILIFENKANFILQEFCTLMEDYQLEVKRCNELAINLKTAMKRIKNG